MKIILAFLLLLTVPLAAQTVAPSQIKPGSNGQVMTTVGGKAAWASGEATVSSVFGRIGDVTAQAGDYNCSQITSAICSLPSLFNQTVEVEGTAETKRPALNFINGSAGTVSCVDNPVTSTTDCTFTGGSSAGITYSIADVTGSRAVNTAYQNTSASPMFIQGSVGTSGSGTGNILVAQGVSSGFLPFVGPASQATATVSGGDAGFSATIMPEYWYIVQTAGAVNGGVHHWTQITSTGSGGGGGGPVLKTNGTTNGSQSLLNLKAGTNMTLTDDGSGGITFDASGSGSGLAIKTNSVSNTSQALLNFTDANGFHFSNPSTGLEEVGVDGTHYLPTTTDQTNWNAKAPLASPTFTGVPAVPTAAPGTNTTQAASTAFVIAAVAGGGSFTPPTGSGFSHNTGGVPDPAARAVNLASADVTGLLSTANGGTGEAGTFTGIRKANSASADTSAVAADFPTLNQNTTGSAAKLTTARAINGVNFDGTAPITITGAPSGSAGGALAGSYPNPAIAGLGSTAGFLPQTDGSGNLLASLAWIDTFSNLQLPFGQINMVGSFPTDADPLGGLPGFYIQNTSCTTDVSANFSGDTGNGENGFILGHNNACFATSFAEPDVTFLATTGAVHHAPNSTFVTITNVGVTSNVATITAANTYLPGQYVEFFNIVNATFLNNTTEIVVSATSTQFTIAFTHANYGPASDTGNGWQVLDNRLSIANEFSGVIDVGSVNTTLLSARTGLQPNGVFFPQMTTGGLTSLDATTGKLNFATTAQQTITINSTACALGSSCTISGGGGGITFPQTVSGTVSSGGLVYANSGTQISVSPGGTAGQVVLWGGAGTAPGAQAIGTSGAAIPLLNTAVTFSGAAAASAPSLNLTGTLFTGGSGTTTVPFDYINNGASGPTGFSTSGTEFGINAPSGFAGNFLDFHVNGVASIFSVGSNGAVTSRSITTNGGAAQISSVGLVQGTTFGTLTNCLSAASPAVCGSAAAGAFTIAAATTTITVNTTAVTANSEINIQPDSSLGTRLGVTCNTTLSTVIGPVVTARTAGASFTVSIPGTLATNPACYSYSIIN